MTGPEHYQKAEELLAHECGVDCFAGHRACARQDAMVHAMLGLAAATADPWGDDDNAWREVTR